MSVLKMDKIGCLVVYFEAYFQSVSQFNSKERNTQVSGARMLIVLSKTQIKTKKRAPPAKQT